MDAITWGGPASITYILSMVFVVGLGIGLYFLLRNKSEMVIKLVLFPLSLFGLAAVIINLTAFNDPLHYLPLEFCSYTAIFIPVLVLIPKRNILGNYLIAGSLGALVALILRAPDSYDWPFLSLGFFCYFFGHMAEFLVPQLLFALKKIEVKPIYMLSSFGIVIVLYTMSFLVGHHVNVTFGLDTNYFFGEHPTNAVLQVAWNILPYPYWYMYLVFPLFAIVFLLYCIPYFVRRHKEKKKEKGIVS